MLKDDLNGNMLCRCKLILCRRITVGTYFQDWKEIMFLSVDGSIRKNLLEKVLLSSVKHT
jgi:hypothetical protein